MSKYGILICPGCGSSINKTSPNMKRCKPCALAAHGQTGNGFSLRNCVMCGSQYKPTGSHQKACAGCTDKFRRQQNSEALAKLRRAAGAKQVGSIVQCESCGGDFLYSSGPQTRCKACQSAAEIASIRKWFSENPEKFAQYKAAAKDNFMFDGNRKLALERDRHTCQRCGQTNDLHVHHIDGNGVTTPRELRNNALDNLITLCRGCHTKTHHEMRS